MIRFGPVNLVRFMRTFFAATIAIAFLLGGLAPAACAGSVSQAMRTYASYCANCHGEWGRGDGPVSPALKTKPKDLSNPERLSKFSDEQLFNAIKYGGPALGLTTTDMPAWGEGLDDDEIKALVSYIRSGLAKPKAEPSHPSPLTMGRAHRSF
jgi:cytochrome c oxidase cbb3-type subunit III